MGSFEDEYFSAYSTPCWAVRKFNYYRNKMKAHIRIIVERIKFFRKKINLSPHDMMEFERAAEYVRMVSPYINVKQKETLKDVRGGDGDKILMQFVTSMDYYLEIDAEALKKVFLGDIPAHISVTK